MPPMNPQIHYWLCQVHHGQPITYKPHLWNLHWTHKESNHECFGRLLKGKLWNMVKWSKKYCKAELEHFLLFLLNFQGPSFYYALNYMSIMSLIDMFSLMQAESHTHISIHSYILQNLIILVIYLTSIKAKQSNLECFSVALEILRETFLKKKFNKYFKIENLYRRHSTKMTSIVNKVCEDQIICV